MERSSDVEPEFHDVAVVHDVVLALEPRLAAMTGLEHRAGVDEVLERDHLGLDEALLEVGVDHAGRLRSLPALADRPGARLLRTRRQIRLQPQRVESDPGELANAKLLLTGRREQSAASSGSR